MGHFERLSFSNLEFLKLVDAVVLGVLMIEAPQALLSGGLHRNYRFILHVVLVILFAELFIIQQTYHATPPQIRYQSYGLVFDLLLLALPFVCLSRMISASFTDDAQLRRAVILFAITFGLIGIRQAWLLPKLPLPMERKLERAVPIGFDLVGVVVCWIGAMKVNAVDAAARERFRNGWAKCGLVLLALYFLFSRLLVNDDQPIIAGYRSLALTLCFIFALSIGDFATKPGTTLIVPKVLFNLARSLCFVPLAWCVVLVFMDDAAPRWQEGAILAFASVGALLTAWAKYTLDVQHAWAGQYRKGASIIDQRGPYCFVRHPIYLGIGIFTFAGVLLLVTSRVYDGRSPIWPAVSGACGLLIMLLVAYVLYVAKQETKALADDNPAYRKYCCAVHGWLPFVKPSVPPVAELAGAAEAPDDAAGEG